MRYSMKGFMNFLSSLQFKVDYVEVVVNNFFTLQFIVTTKSQKNYYVALTCDCYYGIDKAVYEGLAIFPGKKYGGRPIMLDTRHSSITVLDDIVFVNNVLKLLEIDANRSKTKDDSFFKFDFDVKGETKSLCFKKIGDNEFECRFLS